MGLIQAVIFDFDGVLFDSERFHYETLCQILKAELGVDLSWEVFIEKYFGKDDPKIFASLLTERGQDASAERIKVLIQAKVKRYKTTLHECNALPAISGVAKFMAYLQEQSIPMALFSNGNREEVEFALLRLDGGVIKPYLQFITTIDDVQHGKPAPDGYVLSAKQLGVEPQHCLVIEDSLSGIQAGKTAGMTVVGLTTTHAPSILNAHADFVAESYQEIESWVHGKLISS